MSLLYYFLTRKISALKFSFGSKVCNEFWAWNNVLKYLVSKIPVILFGVRLFHNGSVCNTHDMTPAHDVALVSRPRKLES
jgi:hypothetical protein